VLAALKRAGIPRHLQATIAGESLFNDGIGIVLFSLMLSLATGEEASSASVPMVAWDFLYEAVGGGLLDHRFRSPNHIKRHYRACMSRCEREDFH
jgi:monovalent cation:H+ antiporter, CPA1 family